MKTILLPLCLGLLAVSASLGQESKRQAFAIAIHGGAGSPASLFDAESNARRRASLEKALHLGTEILKNGGSSLDAVEQVVRFLEDDPQFNAGKGAVFNAAGGHELDASIMDGSTKACGGVAGVTIVKNPIGLARKVMTDTRHVLLASAGAEAFAKECGVDLVDNAYFSTDAGREEWERAQAPKKPAESKGEIKGTVGCVALDKEGNLAAATSTGGLSNKKFGRVGDSPIIGAGTYADNASCAVSGTGVGEEYIRHAVAYDVSAQMRYLKRSVSEAVGTVLKETLEPGIGGIIAVDKEGTICLDYNTGGMPCAAADASGRFDVYWPNAPK